MVNAWQVRLPSFQQFRAQPRATEAGQQGADWQYSQQPLAPKINIADPGGRNPYGYQANGWDLSQNQYTYNIPTEFRANQNMYQLGYSQGQDRQALEFSGGSGRQTNFDRVYGWLNSLAQQNGYNDISQASPEFQQWAMGAALGRLRTDYAKTGQDWANSGFAGYDRYLAAQGGGGPADPSVPGNTGKPSVTGNPPPAAPPPAPPPTVNANTAPPPAAPPPTKNPDGTLNFDASSYLIDNPEAALKYALRSRGINVDQKGLLGSYLRRKYLDPIKAIITAAGIGGGGSQVEEIQSLLDQFGSGLTGRPGDLVGFMQGLSKRAYDAYSADPGVTDEQMLGMIENFGALGQFGQNSAITAARKSQLDTLRDKYDDMMFNSLSGGGDIPRFTEWLRQQGFRPY